MGHMSGTPLRKPGEAETVVLIHVVSAPPGSSRIHDRRPDHDPARISVGIPVRASRFSCRRSDQGTPLSPL